MKTFLIFAGLFFIVSILHAQSFGDDYVFKSYHIVKRFDSFSRMIITEDTIFQAKRGDGFTIRSTEEVDGDKGYCIVFWKFKKDGQQSSNSTGKKGGASQTTNTDKYIGADENGFTFFISGDDLKAFATDSFKKAKGWFNVNGLVLPIKLRFKNKQPGGQFDFEQSISIGPAISRVVNYGGPFGQSSLSLLTGLNVTNVAVDNNTVANNLVSSKTTVLALSPFVGFNVQYQSITFSLLSGFDIIPGQIGSNWAYRNSPWVGIGIGASIFSPTTTKSNKAP